MKVIVHRHKLTRILTHKTFLLPSVSCLVIKKKLTNVLKDRVSELDSDMVQMLELSKWKFKTTINMLLEGLEIYLSGRALV